MKKFISDDLQIILGSLAFIAYAAAIYIFFIVIAP